MRCLLIRSVLAVGMVAIAGCGGGQGRLTGKVSYQGKPVASGTVVVFASDGLPHYGKIEVDGRYSVDEVPVGEVKLSVNSPNPTPPASKVAAAKTAPTRGGRQQQDPITGPTSDPKLWFEIPARYGDPGGSQLKTSVARGDNSFDIELIP